MSKKPLSLFWYRLIHTAIFVTAALLIAVMGHQVHAGMFLDFDIGFHTGEWHTEHGPGGSKWVGHESPLGGVRIGYQTEAVDFGGLDVRFHGYWGHTSSIPQGGDPGLNKIMMGIRFE